MHIVKSLKCFNINKKDIIIKLNIKQDNNIITIIVSIGLIISTELNITIDFKEYCAHFCSNRNLHKPILGIIYNIMRSLKIIKKRLTIKRKSYPHVCCLCLTIHIRYKIHTPQLT